MVVLIQCQVYSTNITLSALTIICIIIIIVVFMVYILIIIISSFVISTTLSVVCRHSQSENFDSTSKKDKLGRGGRKCEIYVIKNLKIILFGFIFFIGIFESEIQAKNMNKKMRSMKIVLQIKVVEWPCLSEGIWTMALLSQYDWTVHCV